MDKTEIKLSERSWINVYDNIIENSVEKFNDMLKECPKTRDKIRIYGKLIEIPRYQKLYGTKTYKYSGITFIPDSNIPELVEDCFEFARKYYPDIDWNGALVNWYIDGTHYISAHSDDEKDLSKDSPILSFSFGQERIFRIRNKSKKIVKDIVTKHNSVIIMEGNMQKEFTHEITKSLKVNNPRINITIRSFV